jgi:formylglycine-generating enzyme required for sulfatase activity
MDLLNDPRQGRETTTRKVVRGGGTGGPPHRAAFDLRATRRSWSNPSTAQSDVGFRCAKDAR